MAQWSYRFLLVAFSFILLYLGFSFYVFIKIEDPTDRIMLSLDINVESLDEMSEISNPNIFKECDVLNITNSFHSCIHLVQSILSHNEAITINICHNVAITKNDIIHFEHFMTINPWLYFEINCITQTNDILISIYMKYKHRLILTVYEYLVYRQYTSSNITYYGVNEQIWIDFNENCLNRYFGSTLQIFHAEFDFSFTDPTQRYNPVIPHWIHVDENWCNTNTKKK
eukprot:256111_1